MKDLRKHNKKSITLGVVSSLPGNRDEKKLEEKLMNINLIKLNYA